MRSSKKRSRSNQNRPRSLGNIVNRVFDSSGPEGKVRGTPQQIIEKYQALARDAQLSNDRVAAENFLQHAEHYTRMLAEAQREMAAEQEARQQQYQQNAQHNGGRERGERGDYRQDHRGENREPREPRDGRGEGREPRGDYRDARAEAREQPYDAAVEPAELSAPSADDLGFASSGMAADVIDFGADDGNLVDLPEARRRPADQDASPVVIAAAPLSQAGVEPQGDEANAEAAPAPRAPRAPKEASRAPREARAPRAPREPREAREPRAAAEQAEGEKRRERRPRKPRDQAESNDTPEAAQ